MLNYKKIITLGILTLATLAAIAGTGKFVPGVDGSFRGKFKGQRSGRVHFVAKPISGCDSCFIATIFTYADDMQAKVYKALPLDTAYTTQGDGTATEYSLTPLGVDPVDGEITTISEANVHNDNPSKRLSITRNPGEDNVHFSLTESGSNNIDPFNSAMFFDGTGSNYDVDEDGEAGLFHPNWHCRKTIASVGQFRTSNEDLVTRFTTISSFGDEQNRSGTFDLEEKAPGLFTYTGVSLLADGEELANLPSKLVVFIEKGSKERAFLINPRNSADLDELSVR